jgi:hypothetical protein
VIRVGNWAVTRSSTLLVNSAIERFRGFRLVVRQRFLGGDSDGRIRGGGRMIRVGNWAVTRSSALPVNSAFGRFCGLRLVVLRRFLDGGCDDLSHRRHSIAGLFQLEGATHLGQTDQSERCGLLTSSTLPAISRSPARSPSESNEGTVQT